jgi:hypothetical protein
VDLIIAALADTYRLGILHHNGDDEIVFVKRRGAQFFRPACGDRYRRCDDGEHAQ